MKRLALVMFAIYICVLVPASSVLTWLDVTESYIVNPGFEKSTDGWLIDSGVSNARAEYGGMEFWNGWFDICQTIEVPNGKYRLSVQAYYRTNVDDMAYEDYSYGTDDITAYLYANDVAVRVASVYSESLLSTGVGAYFTVLDEDGKLCYYPTSMDAGAYCLGEGMHSNSIEVEVTGGMLNFGIRCQDWQYSNWCMMDNFRLEYYGELIPVSSIAL